MSRQDSRPQFNHLIRDVPDWPEPGIVFKDITPLLASPEGMAWAVDRIYEPFVGKGIDLVAGIESGLAWSQSRVVGSESVVAEGEAGEDGSESGLNGIQFGVSWSESGVARIQFGAS